MRNIFAVFKKELVRFFKDRRMVLSVIMPGIIIYIMYSIMGSVIPDMVQPDGNKMYKISTVNLPIGFSSYISPENASIKNITDSELEDEMKLLENKKVDLIIVFTENFDEKIAEQMKPEEGDVPQIEIYYNSVDTQSSGAYSYMINLCDAYETDLSNRFDVNADPAQRYDVATEEKTTSKIFSVMLPLLMMTFIFSGCQAIAAESIAGEKERGTISKLLVTPIKRRELAFGKIFGLAVIGLFSGLSSFLGTVLSIPNMMNGLSEGTGISANVYSAQDFIMFFFVIMSTVLLIVSIISVISGLAKSVKEASSLTMPLMILVMLISFTPLLEQPLIEGAGWTFIPLYNSVQCMCQILSFEIDISTLLLTIIANLIYTIILSGFLTKIFNSERIMYN